MKQRARRQRRFTRRNLSLWLRDRRVQIIRDLGMSNRLREMALRACMKPLAASIEADLLAMECGRYTPPLRQLTVRA